MQRSPHSVIDKHSSDRDKESPDRAVRHQSVRDQLSAIIEELDDLSEHQAAAHVDMAIQCLKTLDHR